MKCAWKELLAVLPFSLQGMVEPYQSNLQEVRLRLSHPPELVANSKIIKLPGTVSQADLDGCIHSASRYSPWAATTLAHGYLAAPGGHRIGVCGEAIMKEGIFSGIRNVRSVCVRVVRDFCGLADSIFFRGQAMLILGAPGWGKTTLLRDIARQIARQSNVAVVDERQELFPPGFEEGERMDILYGCPKKYGIEIVLKTMTPDCIVVDEITSAEDCSALIEAIGCGVRLIATAHAAGMADFRRRKVYSPLIAHGIFDTFILLNRDKSFRVEENI